MTLAEQLHVARKALEAIVRNDAWSVPVAKQALAQLDQAKNGRAESQKGSK